MQYTYIHYHTIVNYIIHICILYIYIFVYKNINSSCTTVILYIYRVYTDLETPTLASDLRHAALDLQGEEGAVALAAVRQDHGWKLLVANGGS
jgi:hypothetical protein